MADFPPDFRDSLDDFEKRLVTINGVAKMVYVAGSGPAVQRSSSCLKCPGSAPMSHGLRAGPGMPG